MSKWAKWVLYFIYTDTHTQYTIYRFAIRPCRIIYFDQRAVQYWSIEGFKNNLRRILPDRVRSAYLTVHEYRATENVRAIHLFQFFLPFLLQSFSLCSSTPVLDYPLIPIQFAAVFLFALLRTLWRSSNRRRTMTFVLSRSQCVCARDSM